MALGGVLIGVLCVGVFFLAFGGVGVFLLYRGWQQRKLADASKSWPSVPGQVVESHVAAGWSEDSEGDRRRSYTAEVTYSYQVNGQTFTSRQVSFGAKASHGKPEPAQAVVNTYAAGRAVTVYFDPANPAEAVLERRAGGLGITFVMGVVFLLIAVCMACPMAFMALMQFMPVTGAP